MSLPIPDPDKPQAGNSAPYAPASKTPAHDGLHALWSLLLYLAILIPLYFLWSLLVVWLYLPARLSANPIQPAPKLVSETLAFLFVAAAGWILSKVEGRPTSAYGIGSRRCWPDLFTGFASGVLLLSLLVLALRAAGLLVFDGRVLFGEAVLHYSLLWTVVFFSLGLLEEYFNRGFLQFTLARALTSLYSWAFSTRHAEALGFWTAAAILSYLFASGHSGNAGESPIGLLSAGLIGLVFCLSLWRTGSLWWAIGFHTAWDWAQSFLYGVADSGLMVEHHLLSSHPAGKPILSGGLTGPEGSLFMLPIVLLIVVVILVTLPRTRPNPRRPTRASI